MASYRRLPSGKWQATVKHPSGKRYTKTDPLKGVVAEWAKELERQLRRGEFVDPRAGRMTLAEWWARWQPTRRVENATSSKRESVWRVHVEPAFGTWPLASIQSWDVESWIADMGARAVRPHAEQSAVRLLKLLMAEATRHKLLQSNPVISIETPGVSKHVDRFFSFAERDRLLAAMTKPDHATAAGLPRGEPLPRIPDRENQLFTKLMFDCGFRWEESAGVHGFRVDLMRRQIRVQEVVERGGRIKLEPKSEAGQRVVPLTDELVDDLVLHLADRPREGLLFTTSTGRPLDYTNWLARVWNPAVERAKLADPQPTPHDCRHSYGSWLADAGVHPHEIRDLMGHGSLAAVERYLHSSERRMDRARDALGARRAHEALEMREGPASG